MSTVAITGATGLVGANLAEALLSDGHRVIATKRGSSTIDHLAHLAIEWREGDLSSIDSLTGAFEGAEAVFHCAARAQITPRVTKALRADNVVGTDNVLAAVRNAKVKRLIHCSSVVASSITDGTRDATEDDPWNFPEHGMDDGYATTKHESQQRVLAAAATDIDAVVVQPTFMFGPYDIRPSSGEVIVRIAHGKMPFGAPGGQNIVDVRDVARGMILAWQRGTRGSKYILGCENTSYQDVFARIAKELGVKPPRSAPPFFVAFSFAAVVEGACAIVGKDTQISRSTVRYAYCLGHRFSHAKASAALGYSPGSPSDGIRAAISWMRSRKMLPP